MQQQYLSTPQTATLLGLSESTLKRLRKRPNEIPWTKVGSQVRYNILDVRDWMQANQNRHKRSVDNSAPNNSEETH